MFKLDICSVDGCNDPIYVKKHKLCSRHYNRLRTTGTVEDGPRARLPAEERFWRKVVRRGPQECWPWIGKAKIDGYGVLNEGGRRSAKVLAHRFSWVLHNGKFRRSRGYHGTVVMHLCDNRECVNPAHLRLGKQSDNVKDMDEKGRRKHNPNLGEKHHNSRFTEEQVRYIRSSEKTNAELGREFKCARQVIGFIRRRIVWKHLE